MKNSVLTYDQLDSYKKNGFLVLHNVFTEKEVAVWQSECDRLLSLSDYVDPLNLRVGFRKMKTGESMVEKFDPVHDISPVFSDLVKDERILTPLRDIFLDEPCLFKDKLIYKLPRNKGYRLHQDAAWWQGFRYEGLISVMVAIDGADRKNGGLELFPGYQDRFLYKEGMRGMDDEEMALVDAKKGMIYATHPGDVIIFHSLTPHQSGENTTNQSRRQLYLTYSPSSDGQLYKAHYQHFRRYVSRNMETEMMKRSYFK